MTKPKSITPLQRDLLRTAIDASKGKLWLARHSADTLPTTLAAIKSLERRKLVEPEKRADTESFRWKVTKAGRDASKLG